MSPDHDGILICWKISDLSDSHKHTISNDNVVRLTKNQSYTTMADGYFRVNFSANNISGAEYAYGKIDGVTVLTTNAPSSNVYLFGYVENAIFVRKGSVISFDGSTHAVGVFYPLD